MLTKLRAQTKFWMWIVGGAFILTIVFAWGMDFQGGGVTTTLGRVNGRKITIQEYQAALQQNYQIQRQQLGGMEIDDTMLQFVQEQTWQQLVNEILLIQELDRMGLGVTAQELVFVIRNYPPAELRQLPDFQTDGIFDPRKYEAAMVNPSYEMLWLQIEALVASYVPQQKLEHLVSSTALVTLDEAREAYRWRNEEVSAAFVEITPDTRPDSTVTVSDEEVRSYYREHREDYERPARVDFNYVLLYKNPSDRDKFEVRQTLSDLSRRLLQGVEFGSLARQYSEDTTGPQGGDLGWINPGDMVQRFDETAFGLEEGAVSPPVRTEYGWHLVKVDSIRGLGTDEEQRRVRHILLREEASGATLDSLQSALEDLRGMAEENDFNTAASMLGMQVSNTGPVAQGGFIPGIGYEPQVISFGLASRVGEISEVLEHTSAYYVVQVRDKLDAGVAPLEDVRAEIEEQLLWDKQIANLAELAERAARDMKARPDSFSDLAGEYDLEVVETGTFTRNDYVTGVGRDPEFIAVAFTTPVGEVAGPVRGENGWYIIRVREHSDVSGEGIQSLVEAERSRLLSERRRTAFTTWLQGLRARARITDNRSKFGF
ncbi:peptidylprolyl isomerase [Gemmatimonadota bacterium]